jgi:hypothetical protein
LPPFAVTRGVGHVDCAACAGSGVPPAPNFMFGPPFSPSDARIVAHKPESVPQVVRTRARGLDRHCPHGVFHGFQITSHKAEPFSRARNLLSKDDCRASLADEIEPDGPEVPFVGETFALARRRERLAGT